MVEPASPAPKRWTEQLWAINNIIEADGIDWDQPRSLYWNAPCGVAAAPDFAAVRAGVKKLGDIPIEFERQARRREAIAREADRDQRWVTARDNYFMAAIHWGAAQWPIYNGSDQNLFYNKRKRECYTRYAGLADHRVEEATIPLGDRALRAWLHFPVGVGPEERCPVVVSFPGMDSFKEASIALYGDVLLARGIGVLSVDGPGQWEAPLDGVFLTVESWMEAGRACVEYLVGRADVDPDRIGVEGRSFGSFGATLAAAGEPRFKAVAVSATCFEPGFESLCQRACPTFKARLMFMSDYTDEQAFDDFRRSLTWRGRIGSITAPFLCIGGQLDELSAPIHAHDMLSAVAGPKRQVVYEKSRHSVGFGVQSAVLGPNVNILVADWFEDAFAGVAHASEHWFVDSDGATHKAPFGQSIHYRI